MKEKMAIVNIIGHFIATDWDSWHTPEWEAHIINNHKKMVNSDGEVVFRCFKIVHCV